MIIRGTAAEWEQICDFFLEISAPQERQEMRNVVYCVYDDNQNQKRDFHHNECHEFGDE